MTHCQMNTLKTVIKSWWNIISQHLIMEVNFEFLERKSPEVTVDLGTVYILHTLTSSQSRELVCINVKLV